jgi:hypothetical protein
VHQTVAERDVVKIGRHGSLVLVADPQHAEELVLERFESTAWVLLLKPGYGLVNDAGRRRVNLDATVASVIGLEVAQLVSNYVGERGTIVSEILVTHGFSQFNC